MSHRDLKDLDADELEAELAALKAEVARRRAAAGGLVDVSSLEDAIEADAEEFKQTCLDAEIAALPAETDTPKPCPRCGRRVRVRARNKLRVVQTRSGEMALRRNYHYCDHCKGGFFPRDRELGLPAEGDVTFGLEARILDFGVDTPFARAAERWSVHYPTSISENLVRRVVERVGKRCESSDERYLQHALQPPPGDASEYLLVEVDGGMVPLRGDEPWREVKLAAVVRAENHLPGGPTGRGAVSALRYTGVLGSAEELGDSVAKVLEVEQVKRVRKVLWLGDGAAWVWCLADKLCPKAIQILDWYHAIEHALMCAKVLLQDSSLLDDWERTCQRLLASGEVDRLIEELMDCLDHVSGEGVRSINDLVRYYRNNRERMRYDEYRVAGYPIGSGIVESAHRHVIQERMKRPGQRWSVSRARRMVRLRTAYRTGGPKRFHHAIRLGAEATRVAPIQRQRFTKAPR